MAMMITMAGGGHCDHTELSCGRDGPAARTQNIAVAVVHHIAQPAVMVGGAPDGENKVTAEAAQTGPPRKKEKKDVANHTGWIWAGGLCLDACEAEPGWR